jgi:hypothetical protein
VARVREMFDEEQLKELNPDNKLKHKNKLVRRREKYALNK